MDKNDQAASSPPGVKQSAYAEGIRSSSMEGSHSKSAAGSTLRTSRDGKPDVLSESEEEAPHDDPFLFRSMGRKVRDKLKRLSNTLFAKREEEGDASLRAPSMGAPAESEFDQAMQSAVCVPFHEISQGRGAFHTVPMILALLNVIK